MAIKLRIEGNKIYQVDDYAGDILYAVCDRPEQAIALMNRCWDLNDKHRYTDAARAMNQAENLPGFEWKV